MATQLNTYVSPEEYLAVERESDTKSEYYDGVVYAMTGARINHIRIVTNLTVELATQLRGRRCDVLSNEMKVRLQNSRKFFYPDVTVVCGKPLFHDEREDIILNPLLVIEVLSKSTEAFDRGAKFQAYQTLDSLKEYLLVAQDKPIIEQYVRQSDGKWTYTALVGLENSLTLPSVECTLNLSAVYDKVDFDS
jgi:Uma2 family endonuclease